MDRVIIFILLILGFGFLFLSAFAYVVLPESGIGAGMWLVVGISLLMAGLMFAWFLAGLLHLFREARTDPRVEEIRKRKRDDPSYTVNAAVRDLLAIDKREDAIKLHREARGGTIEDARLAVELIDLKTRR